MSYENLSQIFLKEFRAGYWFPLIKYICEDLSVGFSHNHITLAIIRLLWTCNAPCQIVKQGVAPLDMRAPRLFVPPPAPHSNEALGPPPVSRRRSSVGLCYSPCATCPL